MQGLAFIHFVVTHYLRLMKAFKTFRTMRKIRKLNKRILQELSSDKQTWLYVELATLKNELKKLKG